VKPFGAIHHIDITVSDPERAREFYDFALPLMGFRRIEDADEGPLWAGAHVEVGLQTGRTGSQAGRTGLQTAKTDLAVAHDRRSPGLHHLAFTAPSRDAVDALYAKLQAAEVFIFDPPADYSHYAPGYYAVFFADPDDIKLEYVYTPEWPV
jgi:catechol 2,3-dioxygenase-like lactoylglutathione lyase family enzyme